MNEKFYLPATLVLCLLIIVGWYQFIYEPARREIVSMELETRRLREVEREIAELKARHGDLEAFAELKAQQLDEARIYLPTAPAQDEFLNDLYRAAEATDVRILSVRADEVKSKGELQSQAVSVRVEANYIPLLNFIRLILDGERLASLEGVSIERTDTRLLNCELSFKIYAAPDKSQAER